MAPRRSRLAAESQTAAGLPRTFVRTRTGFVRFPGAPRSQRIRNDSAPPLVVRYRAACVRRMSESRTPITMEDVTSRDSEVELEVLRAFARERVETSSVRKIAADVGCNPSTLHKFITSESVPYPRLRRLLTVWYHTEASPGSRAGPEGSKHVAGLALLTAHLSPGLRPAAGRALLAALAHFHASTGTQAPGWLSTSRTPARPTA